MATPRLTRPAALNVIPAADVRDLIEATDRDFIEKEQRAADAVAEAERAEKRAFEAGIDPKGATWAMARMQSFLQTLHEEAERDAAATIDVARRRARMHRDEGRALAEQLRHCPDNPRALTDDEALFAFDILGSVQPERLSVVEPRAELHPEPIDVRHSSPAPPPPKVVAAADASEPAPLPADPVVAPPFPAAAPIPVSAM